MPHDCPGCIQHGGGLAALNQESRDAQRRSAQVGSHPRTRHGRERRPIRLPLPPERFRERAMQTLQGIAVSPGVAIGETLIIDYEGFRIPRRFVARDTLDEEIERLRGAFVAVGDEVESHRSAIAEELGEQYGAIFSAHLEVLRDPQLVQEVEEFIRTRRYSPEYAVSRALRRYAKMFQSLGGAMAERVNDLFDIERKLLRTLLGRQREGLSHLSAPVIVMAHNLTPSETANLDRQYVMGFVTEAGGPGGHTSIVAKAMEIPAVVGVGQFLVDVTSGEKAIIDGDHGRVVLQPDDATIGRYERELEGHRSHAVRLAGLKDLPAETTDGARIHLAANIEFPREVVACVERGADGVGLFRTEFLYLGSKKGPTEEEQFNAYREVLAAMPDKPVVIRTLDLGADKLRTEASPTENNPFLGLRSIRLSLRNLPLFRTQLRAILRASVFGAVKIMFPLVSNLPELRQARMILSEVMEDLEEEGIDFDRNLPVGIMVEVPAAVMVLDHFVREIDFLSIGTNDLIQYALAVDRSNPDVAPWYNAADPAVVRLLEMIVTAAGDRVPTSVCGQMCATPEYIMLLLGMGLRSLSVPPAAIPEVKNIIRSVSLASCERLAARVRGIDNADEIDKLLTAELNKAAPQWRED